MPSADATPIWEFIIVVAEWVCWTDTDVEPKMTPLNLGYADRPLKTTATLWQHLRSDRVARS